MKAQFSLSFSSAFFIFAFFSLKEDIFERKKCFKRNWIDLGNQDYSKWIPKSHGTMRHRWTLEMLDTARRNGSIAPVVLVRADAPWERGAEWGIYFYVREIVHAEGMTLAWFHWTRLHRVQHLRAVRHPRDTPAHPWSHPRTFAVRRAVRSRRRGRRSARGGEVTGPGELKLCIARDGLYIGRRFYK